MNHEFRWGIIGTGNIAQSFAGALHQVADARLHSVLSRKQSRADQFARTNGAASAADRMDRFLDDPDLDVVYIATPHPNHFSETLACLQAGKNVLCEKPIALNLNQTRQMIDAARKNGKFLMEAMWTWFIPATIRAKTLLEEGVIGKPHALMADFGEVFPDDPRHRFFNLELGGGALLDIGIYPLALALYLFGKPDRVTGSAVIGRTGVDESMAAALHYADGRVATALATGRADTPCEAVVAGPLGYLKLHRNFWRSEQITIFPRGQSPQEVFSPLEGNGYAYELIHVQECLREGLLESPVMNWQASLDLMEMMDTLRAQWGLRYPQEETGNA